MQYPQASSDPSMYGSHHPPALTPYNYQEYGIEPPQQGPRNHLDQLQHRQMGFGRAYPAELDHITKPNLFPVHTYHEHHLDQFLPADGSTSMRHVPQFPPVLSFPHDLHAPPAHQANAAPHIARNHSDQDKDNSTLNAQEAVQVADSGVRDEDWPVLGESPSGILPA